MNTCFFIGHREAGKEIAEQLAAEVERHITDYGVQAFIVGGYGGFDRLAAKAVKDAKSRHPGGYFDSATALSPSGTACKNSSIL